MGYTVKQSICLLENLVYHKISQYSSVFEK